MNPIFQFFYTHNLTLPIMYSEIYTSSKIYTALLKNGCDVHVAHNTINEKIKNIGLTLFQVGTLLDANTKMRYNKNNIELYLKLIDTMEFDNVEKFCLHVVARYISSKRIMKKISKYKCVQNAAICLCKNDTKHRLTDQNILIAAAYFDIKVLDARSPRITDNGLQQMRNVESLNISFNRKISNIGFRHLENLHVLYCWGIFNITPDIFPYLRNLKYLFTCSYELAKFTDGIICYIHEGQQPWNMEETNMVNILNLNNERCVQCNAYNK